MKHSLMRGPQVNFLRSNARSCGADQREAAGPKGFANLRSRGPITKRAAGPIIKGFFGSG